MQNLESCHSPAQKAVILVFARSIEHAIEKGRLSGLIKGTTVTARLLVASDVVCCLNGDGGAIDSEMTELADIQIVEGEQSLDCASENDVVIEVLLLCLSYLLLFFFFNSFFFFFCLRWIV